MNSLELQILQKSIKNIKPELKNENYFITTEYTIQLQNETNKPTFIEVCASCGGLSSGLMKAGFEPLLLYNYRKIIQTIFCVIVYCSHLW